MTKRYVNGFGREQFWAWLIRAMCIYGLLFLGLSFLDLDDKLLVTLLSNDTATNNKYLYRRYLNFETILVSL